MDFNQLREEVRDFHKARLDLHKWKLIVVAALGTVGLGLSGKEIKYDFIEPAFILALIPLILLYIDLLQRDLVLKVRVIGRFIDEYNNLDSNTIYGKYESFVTAAYKQNVYKLEGYVSNFSSLSINTLLLVYAIILWTTTAINNEAKPHQDYAYMIIIISSTSCFFLTLFIESLYATKKKAILDLKI